ncbi:CidA/LrgA family protein [Bacillus benzoevorans]|uniref:Holin-like protein n=1 Tax=Bacillus benzoevorans TaxID=1456 RepID=A0A7X0HT73_9BACI|nr:CidA/LrgA family holin-like protein [Bacillus benzoevorans]MBB6446408.1 holin-like protein [Bacillus benzoevorans]
MKLITIIIQILVIYIFLFLGTAIKAVVSLPIPASMIGLLLLLLALKLGVVKLEWIEQGGNWLLAELMLFFVPSAVGIVNYDEIFSWQGFESVLLIGISTCIVIASTAYIAEKINNRKGSEITR